MFATNKTLLRCYLCFFICLCSVSLLLCHNDCETIFQEKIPEKPDKPFYFFHGQNLIEIIKSNAANNLLGFKGFFLSPSLLISERKFNLWIWWNSLILNQTWFSILGVYYHYRRKKKGKSAVRDINGFLEHIKAQLLWGHDRVVYLFLSPNAALMFSEACLPLTQPSNYYLSASFHLAPTALPSLSPPRT